MKLNGDLNYEKKALKALLGSDDIIFFDFETGHASRQNLKNVPPPLQGMLQRN